MFINWGEIDLKSFLIYNSDGIEVNSISDFPIFHFNLFSFFENSEGNFIFTGETLNQSTSVITGLIFCLNKTGDVLWQKTYQPNIASVFLSVNEMSNGYIFTGYNTTTLYDDFIDWRKGFINERDAKAIVLKTDLNGERIWEFSPPIQQEAVFGAVSLYSDDKITFFGQRVNNSIINTMIMDIDAENLIN